ILKNVDLHVKQGDRLLIEGPSGSGKSTLVKTMMNELRALEGAIQYGRSLKGDLRDQFAVVEQQPFVFHNTLRYNLVLGKEATDEELLHILESVGLTKFANESGLHTELGTGHHQLSGGELKRLEVARALLYNKKVLVVDEALSGLDEISADGLNQLIMDYPGTVIDIEHRLDHKISDRFNKKLHLSSV